MAVLPAAGRITGMSLMPMSSSPTGLNEISIRRHGTGSLKATSQPRRFSSWQALRMKGLVLEVDLVRAAEVLGVNGA